MKMTRTELLLPQGRNFTGRRIAAFIIDVLVANCIAFSIPWTIAEMTQGRYRLTEVPGFSFTYCAPDPSESALTAELRERAARSPPPFKTYLRTEHCVTRLNLILRNPFVRVTFQSSDSPGLRLLFYSTPLDFNGNASSIQTLNQYAFCFPILFFVAFLTAAWLDSPGTRLLGIRIRTLDGAKLGYAEFVIRYAIIGIVFAPFLLVFTPGLLSIGLTLMLAAILLFPWFKGGFQHRRGLHDILGRTMVIRAP